jgi:hypothetical protein
MFRTSRIKSAQTVNWFSTYRISKHTRQSAGDENMAKAKRTTHRSSKGTKLYAVRDSNGRFKDIQTYKRAHSADMRRKSKSEA